MKTGVILSSLKLLAYVLGIVFLTGCGHGNSFGIGNSTAINASMPVIEIQPANAVYVQGDTAIPLEIIVSVDDGGVITYQWYSNGINSNENGSIISGETSSSYTPPTSVAGTTYYYAVVTNTNDNAKKEKKAFVVSDVVSITVDTLSVSFYDENLNLLAKYDNLYSGHEVELNSNKTAYNITDWYFASNNTAVDSYTITDKSVNFYASSDITEIATQDDLIAIETNLTGKYILLNDIALDENGAGFDGNGWLPIGDEINEFTGIFNGNYHKITNLWINREHITLVGFFSAAENASISNLGIEIAKGKSINGYDYIGSIAGWIINGNISNVYSTGTIDSTGTCCVGGIIGHTVNSTITNVYSTVNISSNNFYIGGIIGHTVNSTITNVYSTGDINGTENVNGNGSFIGGIAGRLDGGSITNSYSTGNINGMIAIGGIVGESYYDNGLIRNNAAINSFVYGDGSTNRITNGNVTALNNFALDSMIRGIKYDDTTSTFTDVGNATYHGIDKTIEQLKTKETYSDAVNGDGLGGLGWNFGDNDTAPWKIDGAKNNGLPYLYWQKL
ncbi:MAG: hypothetical protein LBL65_04180 [Campylobacteraceae bacterium]|jgi:hypothetical protein|nr:hypothetical protein [Campylobacteraceae bacterium]